MYYVALHVFCNIKRTNFGASKNFGQKNNYAFSDGGMNYGYGRFYGARNFLYII